MSYPSAPPPSGGVNPYGEQPEVPSPASAPVPPPPPPPTATSSGAPWQTPAYGTPPPTDAPPAYGSPGQTYGGPSAGYSPYSAASRYPGAPGYGGWVTSTRDNGKGTGALVLGIISIVLCFGVVLGIGLGAVAIVLGVQGRRAAAAGTASNGSTATAGMVLGIIGASLGLIVSLGYLANLAAV